MTEEVNTDAEYRVKASALRSGEEVVGYTVFVVDEKDRIVGWAIREDELRNRLSHAGTFAWPQMEESALARYEEADDQAEPGTRPYAPLIKSVRLPADEEAA
jgi:hypothetical protein